MRRTINAFALLTVMALAIAGCGGGDDSSTGGANGGGGYGGGGAEKPASGEEGGGVVAAADVGELGTILVDAEGRTLYDFHKDKGTASSCYGACAEGWPPLLSEGEPQAEAGAMASELGTTERKDGTTQVTYAGHPLYTFVGDEKAGEANGNDVDAFGAEWYALQPNGEEPED